MRWQRSMYNDVACVLDLEYDDDNDEVHWTIFFLLVVFFVASNLFRFLNPHTLRSMWISYIIAVYV